MNAARIGATLPHHEYEEAGMPEERIGIVKDYFAKIGVAGIDVETTLRVGDRIHIKGHATDLEETVESIQIEHAQVEQAKRGAA